MSRDLKRWIEGGEKNIDWRVVTSEKKCEGFSFIDFLIIFKIFLSGNLFLAKILAFNFSQVQNSEMI